MTGELQNFFANVTTSAQFKSILEDRKFIRAANKAMEAAILAITAALLLLPKPERILGTVNKLYEM